MIDRLNKILSVIVSIPMDRFQQWTEKSTPWWWPIMLLFVCATLAWVLVINKSQQERFDNLQQWEPIETAGPDMPIYTKTKEWLLHLLGKWAESDKPKVIASSEDKK